MKRTIIALGAVLAWVCGVYGATHEGVQLWENGPLWAKTNVGANSPTETGYYFWWGDTLGYKWQNSKWGASDGSVNNFSFSTANCPTYGKSLAQLQSMGVVGADGNLLPACDAAAQQWGDDWRMPKASELRNLLELCSWNWTTNNNVAGYTVTGKGLYSGNSIFIPDVGYIDGTAAKASGDANLWSSIVEGAGAARACLKPSRRWCSKAYERYWGFSIRPVKSMSAANGDFRLKGASPCIDMGNNKYASGETDIRGNTRVQNGIVDLGAYEFTLPKELGSVPVDGTDAAVPVEWLGAYGYVDEDSTPASLQPIMAQVGDNGIPLWQSWVAGFDSWDPDSELLADIKVVGDEVEISWTPDLSNATPKRHYTVMGKTNLTDTAWVIPVNETHHFFKVSVTISEPGLAKDVAATSGTSAEEVTLSWRAADWAVAYNVYRSTVDDFSRAALLATVDGTGFVDDTAVPGTRYHYWIVSVANGGEWMTSESAAGYRKIAVPRNVAASDGTSVDWVTVTWNATPGAEGYKIYRGTSNNPDTAEVVSSVPSVPSVPSVSFEDASAEPGTLYYYWVTATNAVSESAKSAVETGFRSIPAPTGVTATTMSGAAAVTVSWQPVDGALYYRVYRGTRTGEAYAVEIDTTTATSYADESGAAGKTYYYSVKAVGTSTESGFSAFVSGSR